MYQNLSILTKDAVEPLEMNVENVAAVVVTGLVVVFIGLILLILFVQLLGFIFSKTPAKKTNNDAVKSTPVAPVKAVVANQPVNMAPFTSTVDNGIDEETVVAITSAVAVIGSESGQNLAIKSIKKAD